MAKAKKLKAKRSKRADRYIAISNRSYGNVLKGIKVYYEGKRPRALKDDGSIGFGKHILEMLRRKYGSKFRWVITPETNSIEIRYGITSVRVSQKTLTRMNNLFREQTRGIKNDIVANFFSDIFPGVFSNVAAPSYIPGSLAKLLGQTIIARLSSEDREAMNKLLPDYIASEALGAVSLLSATAQIKTLKQLAADLEVAIQSGHSEGWWQKYIKSNILIIQQGYIEAIEKMNVAIGGTKYPDFALVTHDNYLDILEIKKPDTPLLKYDSGRNNYFWDSEIAKALIQVENYIEHVSVHRDVVRSYLKDEYRLDLKVLRPRGIILAGNTGSFSATKQSDDFRLLSLSTKNIVFVTYDELLSRLKNYIKVLEDHSKAKVVVQSAPRRRSRN